MNNFLSELFHWLGDITGDLSDYFYDLYSFNCFNGFNTLVCWRIQFFCFQQSFAGSESSFENKIRNSPEQIHKQHRRNSLRKKRTIEIFS